MIIVEQTPNEAGTRVNVGLGANQNVGDRRIIVKFCWLPRCIDGVWSWGDSFVHQEFVQYIMALHGRPCTNYRWKTRRITRRLDG